jgi:hypothetical protein
VEETTTQLVSRTLARIFETVADFVELPPKANVISANRFNLGLFGETQYPSESVLRARERYFYGVLEGFKNANGAFLLSFVYVGFPNGAITGVKVTTDTNGDQVVASASRDTASNSSTNCYVTRVLGSDHSRDNSQVLATDCLYRPYLRPWFMQAAEKGSPGWSSVYTFSGDNTLGITAYYPIFDPDAAENTTASLLAVFAVDVPLSYLTEFLAITVGNGTRTIIVDPNDDGALIASSTREVTQTLSGSVVQLKGVDMKQDLELAATASFVEDRVDPDNITLAGYDMVDSTIAEVIRPIFAPLTFAGRVIAPNDMEWVVIVAADRTTFYGTVEDRKTYTFLVTHSLVPSLLLEQMW